LSQFIFAGGSHGIGLGDFKGRVEIASRTVKWLLVLLSFMPAKVFASSDF
jgi:hypothetical protein